MSLRVTILSVAAMFVAVGWYQMFRFSSTPGKQFAAPARWPSDVVVSGGSTSDPRDLGDLADSGDPLLLAFVHPQCSCTHATLEELDQILDSSPATVRVALVVYQSKVVDPMVVNRGAGEAPKQGSDAPGRQRASFPTGLLHRPFRTILDTDGVIARRFGAATSGEIVLYSGDGRLLFQGGITAERAHVGASTGGDSLRNALTTGVEQGKQSSVFGCPIFVLGHAG
jgi:hypothetical protein